MTKKEFIKNIQDETGIMDYEEAEKATSIVLNKLNDRLTPEESDDVKAQLPNDMKELWNDENWASKFVKNLGFGTAAYDSKEELYEQVTDELSKNDIAADPEKLVHCVVHCLKQQVSEGEMRDVAAQMPADLKDLFTTA